MKKRAIIGLGAGCFVVVFAFAILGFGMIQPITESNDNSINNKLLTQSANDYDDGKYRAGFERLIDLEKTVKEDPYDCQLHENFVYETYEWIDYYSDAPDIETFEDIFYNDTIARYIEFCGQSITKNSDEKYVLIPQIINEVRGMTVEQSGQYQLKYYQGDPVYDFECTKLWYTYLDMEKEFEETGISNPDARDIMEFNNVACRVAYITPR